jgi:hypothetical protein
MTRLHPALLTLAALLLSAPALAQGAPPPAGAAVSRGVETTAIVESIDQRTRQVLLRREDGTMTSFRAGPEIRNLDQVVAGDRVRLRYVEAIAASLAPPGQRGPAASADAAAVRAARGERPGAGAVQVIRARVKFTSFDAGSGRVSFVSANGVPQTAVLHSPQMMDFARTLKPGDEVNVSYAEAVVVDVTKAP